MPPTRLAGLSARAPDQRGDRPPLLDTPPMCRGGRAMSDRQSQPLKKKRSGSETRERDCIIRVSRQGGRTRRDQGQRRRRWPIGRFIYPQPCA